MGLFLRYLVGCLAVASGVQGLGPSNLRGNLKQQTTSSDKRAVDPSTIYTANYFSVPVDHFQNESRYEPHSSDTFSLRYWFDATYYQPGGPVIVFQGGETDATYFLDYLQDGIGYQLAKATGGISVLLEHRYYGKTFPVPDLTTANMRFLTVEQSLADQAYFAQNIQFPGLESYDLTSASAAWIAYGGSYSGSFSAWIRIQYPDIFWGAIASSSVPNLAYEYWQYYTAAATYGPKACIQATKTLVGIFDQILLHNAAYTNQLKSAFGLSGVTHNDDFMSVLSDGILWFQSLQWDTVESPGGADHRFYDYCKVVGNTSVVYPATSSLRANATALIKAGGGTATTSLVNQMLNYIGYINSRVKAYCPSGDQDYCFNYHTPKQYQYTSTSSYGSRSWAWQTCTEIGTFLTGSGLPSGQQGVVSRTIDLPYETLACSLGFGITTPPDTSRLNKYGGAAINYNRLALIDGEWDPWRAGGPHGFNNGAKQRTSTTDQPFILIPAGVHHWDESGRFPNETTSTTPPQAVQSVQAQEVQFVQQWMVEYNAQKK